MKCKVCAHPKRKQIDRELVGKWRSKGSFRNIAQRYGLHFSSVYRHFCEHIPPQLWQQESTRRRLGSENLLELLIEEANEVRRLRQACTEWLQDPEDPSRLTVDPRAEDVSVVYVTFNEKGSPVKARESLNVLLRRCEKELKIAPAYWTVKHPDPGSKLIAAAKAFAEFGQLIARIKGELKDVLILQDTAKIERLARGLMDLIPAKDLPRARAVLEANSDEQGG